MASAFLLDDRNLINLYTESLIKREETYIAYINNLFNGHFPTISTLLGFFPIKYWINVSISSTMNDLMINPSFITADDNTRKK
jgi:hypothetical protein